MDTTTGYNLDDWPASTAFVPYVGTRYWDGFRAQQRVLILGESHYDRDGYLANCKVGDERYRRYTCEVVRDYVPLGKDGDPNLGRFWGPLSKMLTGREFPSAHEVGAAWDRIAYMNYVQCIVGKEGQSPKSKEMWGTGEPALLDALRILGPTRVLILGVGTWNHVRYGEPAEGEIHVKPSLRPVRGIWRLPHFSDNHGGACAYASFVYHPSSRAPYPDPWKVMKSVLDQLIDFRPRVSD